MTAPMEWRECAGFPRYEISEYGDIRTSVRSRTRCVGHIVKGYICGGYRMYKLIKDGSKVITRAHRLVLETFVCTRPSDLHIGAHWDGNPLNNHYTNLRWATQKENQLDRVRHSTDPVGERNPNSRFTEIEVINIRNRYTGSYGDIINLAREFGVGRSTIDEIVHRVSWRHVG